MNALSHPEVVDYLNENFVCTYLKVGTFQIVNGQKVGGNVASYFCLWDGAVVHAAPGKMDSAKFLSEARWALETRKSALTLSTDFRTGRLDTMKYRARIMYAHLERFRAEQGNPWGQPIPAAMPNWLPKQLSQQAQAEWLLSRYPLAQLDFIYPLVWRQILNEQLSTLPVRDH